jgi:hypothetical protein
MFFPIPNLEPAMPDEKTHNEKTSDAVESQASDRRKEAKARTKFGNGKDDKQAVKETVKLWRDGTGAAVDKL